MHQIINGKKKIKLGVLKTKRDFNYVSNTIDGIISLIGAKKLQDKYLILDMERMCQC